MLGKLGHYPVPFTHLVDGLFLQTIGIFGTPVGVSATYAFLFILFGEFLVIQNGRLLGSFNPIAGRSSGGPAKVAVISSCLLGTITEMRWQMFAQRDRFHTANEESYKSNFRWC